MGAAGSVQRNTEPSARDFFFSTVICEGKYSSVISAIHIESKTWMAIKRIKKKRVFRKEEHFSLTLNEIEILKRIETHSSIVSLQQSFSDEKYVYMAFNLLTGGSLRHHLNINKQFSELQAAYFVICISSALQHCHSMGILHRDVKPDNILLDCNGHPQLTNFSCSFYSTSEKRSDGSQIICQCTSGTRLYMAPEVFTESHRHGIESDFWSLGIVLYEMIYATTPHQKHCSHEFINFAKDIESYQEGLCLGPNEAHGASAARSYFAYSSSMLDDPLDCMQMIGAEDSTSTSCAVITTPPKCEQAPIYGTFDSFDEERNLKRAKKENNTLIELLAKLRMEASAERKEAKEMVDKAQHSTRRHLPSRLRIEIPPTNTNGEEISLHCIDILEGLLDVRVWERYGAGKSFDHIKVHPW